MIKIGDDQIRLIVTDIDGTLIDDQWNIPNDVKTCLLALQKRGVLISIASGRTPGGFETYTKQLEIDKNAKYVVGANGAIIFNSATNETKYVQLMSPKDANFVCDILVRHECPFIINYYDQDYLYCHGEKLLALKLKPGAFLDGKKAAKKFKNDNNFSALKIVVKATSAQLLTTVTRLIKVNLNVSIELTGTTMCDIMARGKTKGEGVLALLELLNHDRQTKLTRNNVLYFGDNWNDLSAFQIFPYSVAMANAPVELKEHCYQVTSSNNESGIKEFLTTLMAK